MARLTSRLDSLVGEIKDPWVYAFVIENLGKGVQLDPSYANQIVAQKTKFAKRLNQMIWASAGQAQDRVPFEKFPNPLAKLKHMEAQRMLLKEAEVRTIMQQFAKHQMELAAKSERELAVLVREFQKEDTVGILCRLKDEEPLNRWMAIQITQYRWEPLENFLVEALEDPVPMVRGAARQALVKLSRGNDFGPIAANPSRDQIHTAQKHWRSYLAMQDGVTR